MVERQLKPRVFYALHAVELSSWSSWWYPTLLVVQFFILFWWNIQLKNCQNWVPSTAQLKFSSIHCWLFVNCTLDTFVIIYLYIGSALREPSKLSTVNGECWKLLIDLYNWAVDGSQFWRFSNCIFYQQRMDNEQISKQSDEGRSCVPSTAQLGKV